MIEIYKTGNDMGKLIGISCSHAFLYKN